jgi:hypothetical protein
MMPCPTSEASFSARRESRCPIRIRLPAAQAGQRQRRRADALDRRAVHHVAVSRLAPDDGDAARRGRVREPQTRAAADAADGDRRARAEAENEQAHARPPDLSLSPARRDDRARKPCLGGRHHLHSDRTRLSLPRGDHRLGVARGACVAAVEHDGRFVLSGCAQGGSGEVRQAGDFEHRSGLAVHLGRLHRRAG